MNGSSAAEFSQWDLQPAGTEFVHRRLEDFCQRSQWLAALRRRMLNQTGTRLFDWVDTIHSPSGSDLKAVGFDDDDPFSVSGRWHHPSALLPWVVNDGQDRVVLRVDSVVDFVRAHAWTVSPEPEFRVDGSEGIWGDPTASRRGAVVSNSGGVEVAVLERHGDQGSACFSAAPLTVDPNVLQHHRERLRLRKRDYLDPVQGIEQTIVLVESVIDDLGVDRACDLFFETEREYWQLRNDAAAIQYRSQAKLGLGWANHDHHTYRSSRVGFAALVQLLETLGMQCRERFYAGADAGWGAQVLEQSAARIVVFADVDMTADEVLGDFAHDGLQPSEDRGTVGLWCHLHGEAVLQAGMHHLECQFAFTKARELLADQGADSLNPFSDFDYLKQSFTRGQTWAVESSRVESARQNGWINAEQAERFRTQGVTGSHLEVLERNDGYKGFNQTGISDIIARTDPRNENVQ